MKFLFTAIAITAACGGCSTAVQSDPAPLRSEFEAAAPAWLQTHRVPGVAVAFIQNGEVSWTAAAGRRDGDEPARVDTVWNVASLAKPATAQVIIELTGRGVIDLDTPMSHAYVDADLSQGARLEALTPRVALLHQTGFANWRRETEGVLQFQFTPGTQTRYSGEGYTYLARYAEAVTGVPFPDLADDLVFSPLGMGDTDFRAPSTFAPTANAHNERGEPIGRARGDWSGADDLSTTVADYAALMLHAADVSALTPMLAEDRHRIVDDQLAGGCPLPEVYCPTAVGFGLGWEIFEYGETHVIQHGGADSGERALAFYDPAARTGAVIATNGANGGRVIAEVAALLYPENAAYLALLRLQAGLEIEEPAP
jgi:CubicO group peptidase (beta-lactamase class C family)